MSYTTIVSVQALNSKRTTYSDTVPSGGTRPTATQVGTFITDIAGQIDAVLASVYVATPVTAPASFLSFLDLVNAWGAAALAEAAAFPEFDGGPGNTPQAMRYWKMYQDALAAFADGKMIDPSVAVSAADTLARSYLSDNPDNTGYDEADGVVAGSQPPFSMATSGVDY